MSDRYDTITFAVDPADLGQIAAVSAVHAVSPELSPLFNAVTCPWGTVRSEGDTQLQADQARTSFGVNGAGVKVGIISDSFDTWSSAPTRWSTDVASGDLPGATNTCGFTTPVSDLLDGTGNDEGRAMAQVVHDVAPGASLAFASANASTAYPDLVGSFGADAAGSGLLNAPGAVGALVTADPTATTGSASDIGWQSAKIAGTANPKGYATGYRFQYGTTTAYGSATTLGDAGSGTDDVPVTAQLTGLTPNTTYHYRLVAIRFGSIVASGTDQTFTTQPAPTPTVTTGAASAVGPSTATVAGTVNPNGYPTGYRFEYGATTAYGSTTVAGNSGAGTSGVTVSAQLTGLTPSTTYHYRLVGLHGSSVAAAGSDQTFTTQKQPVIATAPINTALPTITGTATPGATLTCSAGSWIGASSYAYQWLRDAVPVPGAGAQTFRPASRDLGHRVACRVTARNAAGSTSATSAAVKVVDLAPPRLTGLKLSPNRFKAASSGASVVLTGKQGTLVRSVLDEAATVTFGVERSQLGRTVKGRCQRPTRANAKAKRCTMWMAVKGTFRWSGKPGTNTFRFTGRVNGKALAARQLPARCDRSRHERQPRGARQGHVHGQIADTCGALAAVCRAPARPARRISRHVRVRSLGVGRYP